jgi:hypothetical protein
MKPPPGFGKEVNHYLNHYVNVADAKAAGVLTADLTIGGYLITTVPVTLGPQIFHWAALDLLIESGIMALRTLYLGTPKIGSSPIFWEDVRARATIRLF